MRWGILGSGRVASDFANCLNAVEAATLVAVGASSVDKAKEFAEQHNIPKAYGSYEELAQAQDVDIVYVATIHPRHKEHTILCLKSGKHVLVEKPMSLSAKDTKEMVACARENDRFLLEGMWTRFFPAIKKIQELIASGTIGDVVSAYADFGFKCDPNLERLFDPKMGGGALMDIGIYPLTAIQCAFGSARPSEIKATGILTKTKVDFAAAIALQYQPHGTGLVHYSLQAETPEELTLVGTKGRIRVHAPAHCPTAFTLSLAQGRGNVTEQRYEFPLPEVHGGPPMVFPNSQGFVYEAEAIDKAVAAGKRECPEFSLDESILTAELMDDILGQLGVSYPQTQ